MQPINLIRGTSKWARVPRSWRLLAVTACALGVWAGGPVKAQTAYVTNADGFTVSVIDVAQNRVVGIVETGNQPRFIAVAPDARRILVSHDSDWQLMIIDVVEDRLLHEASLWEAPGRVAWSPDGSWAYVLVPQTGDVAVLDTESGELAAIVPVYEEALDMAVTPDGTRLYVTRLGGVSVIDAATRTVAADISLRGPWELAVAPDGARLFVSQPWRNAVAVINTASNAVVATIPVERQPRGLAVTPDGERIYVANRQQTAPGHPSPGDFTVSVIDVPRSAVAATVNVRLNQPEQLAITPDGRQVLVTGYASGRVAVINTAAGASVLVADGGIELSPGAVAVAPDPSRRGGSRPQPRRIEVANAPRSGWTQSAGGSEVRRGPAPGQIWFRFASDETDVDSPVWAEVLLQFDCTASRVRMRTLQALGYRDSRFVGPIEDLTLTGGDWSDMGASDPELNWLRETACRR